MAFGLCGKMMAIPGQGDALAKLLLEGAASLEDFHGCQLYLVNRAPEDPDAVWVVEVWDDAEAHQASLQLDAVREVIARARPIIADMSERIELQPIGGKGLADRSEAR